MEIIKLQNELLEFFNDKELYSSDKYLFENDDVWSLADLIARQWINNGEDGFGMVNIRQGYQFVINNLETLINYKMISKDGYNNAGFPLWKNYKIK